MSDFDKKIWEKLDEEDEFPRMNANWEKLSARLDAFPQPDALRHIGNETNTPSSNVVNDVGKVGWIKGIAPLAVIGLLGVGAWFWKSNNDLRKENEILKTQIQQNISSETQHFNNNNNNNNNNSSNDNGSITAKSANDVASQTAAANTVLQSNNNNGGGDVNTTKHDTIYIIKNKIETVYKTIYVGGGKNKQQELSNNRKKYYKDALGNTSNSSTTYNNANTSDNSNIGNGNKVVLTQANDNNVNVNSVVENAHNGIANNSNGNNYKTNNNNNNNASTDGTSIVPSNNIQNKIADNNENGVGNVNVDVAKNNKVTNTISQNVNNIVDNSTSVENSTQNTAINAAKTNNELAKLDSINNYNIKQGNSKNETKNAKIDSLNNTIRQNKQDSIAAYKKRFAEAIIEKVDTITTDSTTKVVPDKKFKLKWHPTFKLGVNAVGSLPAEAIAGVTPQLGRGAIAEMSIINGFSVQASFETYSLSQELMEDHPKILHIPDKPKPPGNGDAPLESIESTQSNRQFSINIKYDLPFLNSWVQPSFAIGHTWRNVASQSIQFKFKDKMTGESLYRIKDLDPLILNNLWQASFGLEKELNKNWVLGVSGSFVKDFSATKQTYDSWLLTGGIKYSF